MRTILGLMLLALFASACQSVQFSDPQPLGVSPENRFPSELQGIYGAEGDTLIIEAYGYRATEKETRRILLQELDSAEFEIKGESISPRHLGDIKHFSMQSVGDTLIYETTRWKEVLLSDSLQLMSWKGYYFLNSQSEKGWEVFLLQLRPDESLSLRSIDADEEVSWMSQVMKVDTIFESDGKSVDYYRVSPRKQELLQFIGKGGFSELFLQLERL
jgi:hypothetical protein